MCQRIVDAAHAQGFFKEIVRFLKSRPGCTAIVCCNYMILQAVLKALKIMGKEVPGDYSVVCFDYSKNDWLEAGMTCSVHPGYEMGQQVGLRLMKMIENKEFCGSEYSYTFEPRIYEGRSICECRDLTESSTQRKPRPPPLCTDFAKFGKVKSQNKNQNQTSIQLAATSSGTFSWRMMERTLFLPKSQ